MKKKNPKIKNQRSKNRTHLCQSRLRHTCALHKQTKKNFKLSSNQQSHSCHVKSYIENAQHAPIFPLNTPCNERKNTSGQNDLVSPKPTVASASPSGPRSSTGRRPMRSDAHPQWYTVSASVTKKTDSCFRGCGGEGGKVHANPFIQSKQPNDRQPLQKTLYFNQSWHPRLTMMPAKYPVRFSSSCVTPVSCTSALMKG